MPPAAHHIDTRIHGRYLVEPGAGAAQPLLVGFHGYAERAEHMLDVLRRIRGERAWTLVSVQALHRFYTRSSEVVANWMTREDRELAIADNIAYVASVVAAVRDDYCATDLIVYAGFSQGVAMAYRAAAFAHEHTRVVPAAQGGIMLAGDVPPDVAPAIASLPPLLIGRGTRDNWYTEEKAAADLRLFANARVSPRVHLFDGAHEWEESFVAAAGEFLDGLRR